MPFSYTVLVQTPFLNFRRFVLACVLCRAPAGLIAHAALFALQLRLIMNLLQLVQALLQAKEIESNRLSL